MPNGDDNSKSNASRSIQRDSVHDGQADDFHGKEASSEEANAEPAGPVPILNVTQPSDGSDLVSQPCSSNVLLNFHHKSGFGKAGNSHMNLNLHTFFVLGAFKHLCNDCSDLS